MREEEKRKPLVTVVTATFNIQRAGRMKYLVQNIESVHAQTYGEIEHLIIDGASTDGTLEALRPYEAKGWITIHSEPDKGIYDAMNKGIAKAQGKYIAFLNSDDYWHDPRGIEASVALLEAQHGDFSYGHARVLRADDTIREYATAEIGYFLRGVPCCHQTMLTRTALLQEAGGYRGEIYKVAADYDFTVRMLLSGRLAVFVPLCFTTFRHGGCCSADLESELRARQDVENVGIDHLSPYLGDAPKERYVNGADPQQFARLMETLHPAVAAQVQTHAWENKGRVWLPPRRYLPYEKPGYADEQTEAKQIRIRICFLPVYKMSRSGCRSQESYFNALYVTRELAPQQEGDKAMPQFLCVKLFNWIPLWSRRVNRAGTVTHKLFHLIPVSKRVERP